jgi:hypothetical protein
MKNSNVTLMASTPIPMSMFCFQTVFSFTEGNKYLKSINLLMDGKIIKKIYLDQQQEIDEETDTLVIVKEVIRQKFFDVTRTERESHKVQTKKANKLDMRARANAAAGLFEALGI